MLKKTPDDPKNLTSPVDVREELCYTCRASCLLFNMNTSDGVPDLLPNKESKQQSNISDRLISIHHVRADFVLCCTPVFACPEFEEPSSMTLFEIITFNFVFVSIPLVKCSTGKDAGNLKMHTNKWTVVTAQHQHHHTAQHSSKEGAVEWRLFASSPVRLFALA